MRILTILYEDTTMTLSTRTVCLKTGAVLQTVSKDCRRICFQELHIIKQYVRYETKNKLLLGFWRKYMTFKSKQWLSFRVKMSSLFSWILLLKNARLLVESFKWIMSMTNTEFPPWRKPQAFTKYLRQL